MLTKKQTLYLSVLNELFPYGTRYDESTFYCSPLVKRKIASNFDFAEFAEICRSLEELGYIRSLNVSSQDIVYSLEITHLGRNHRELQRLDAWKVLIERIHGFVFGIAASITTYFVINAITAFLAEGK